MATTRTRAALLAVGCSIIGAMAGNGLLTAGWSVGAALLENRPRGWGALACLALGCILGGFYGWQIGQAIAMDAEPEPPAQTPGAPPQPPQAPGPRQGWVTRMATTQAKRWGRKGQENP